MKNILVICQYYYPEPVRITDICEELVKKGYNVSVITDYPNYPMGDVYDSFKKNKTIDEIINGVNIHRCYTIPRKKSILMRFLNYYSFSISSSRYVRKIKNNYDVVFVNQLSPVMMAKAGLKYKKKNNKKVVLYCLDLWPESLCAGGIKKKSFIYNIYKKVSEKIYKQCDKILVTSSSFMDYFKENFGICNKSIDYLPQYAENIFNPKDCIKKENKNIDLVFAGNIGKAQSMNTIILAANELKKEKNVFFHIIGDGSEYSNVKNMVKKMNLENVILYGRKPLDEMPKYYSMADAMLVSLSGDSLVSTTLPGKVQSYMAAGKPIIAAANGETKLIIDKAKCGFCGSADNYMELAKNIKKFLSYNDKKKLADNSYSYYFDNMRKDIFINKLINELNKEM